MTTVERYAPSASRVLRHLDEAVAHVRVVCFTTGPPGLIGVELGGPSIMSTHPPAIWMWSRCARPVRPHAGPHHIGRSTWQRLAVEPGGRVEISTVLPLLTGHRITGADLAYVIGRLAATGTAWSARHRRVPTSAAAAASVRRHVPSPPRDGGAACVLPPPSGSTWTPASRIGWGGGGGPCRLGPVLLALFATSRRHAGVDTIGPPAACAPGWRWSRAHRPGPVDGDPPPAGHSMRWPRRCMPAARRGLAGRWR